MRITPPRQALAWVSAHHWDNCSDVPVRRRAAYATPAGARDAW